MITEEDKDTIIRCAKRYNVESVISAILRIHRSNRHEIQFYNGGVLLVSRMIKWTQKFYPLNQHTQTHV